MTIQRWDFDLGHSSVGFSVRHLMVSKVHGRFARWSGTLLVDEQDPAASRVEVEIDAASIDTGDQKRDEHLRSADFFDVEAHPKITFASTGVERTGEGELRVTGDLTIRGVTKKITLDVEDAGRAKDPWGGERAGFSAKSALARKDFGLVWNVGLEAGGVLVGDKVEIQLEIQAVKAQAAAAARAAE